MDRVSVENMLSEDFRTFIESFDYVLSDCCGVIWHTMGTYPGSGDFFETLKKLGKQVFYVSNNTARKLDNYAEKFKSTGIENGLEGLILPTEAIAHYLKSRSFDKKVFCVSNPVSMKALEAHGFDCKTGPSSVEEDFHHFVVKYIKDDPEIGAVVFDGDYTINLAKLYMATTYLKRPEVHFISGPTDKYIPVTKELKCLGVGQFCDIVADFTGRQPEVLAKPGKPFAEYLIRRIGISDPSRVLFIGDMLEQDIGLGKIAGFQTLLVLGTETEEKMQIEKTFIPDFYTKGLGEIVQQLRSLLQ